MNVIICDDNKLSRDLYSDIITEIAADKKIDTEIRSIQSGEELLKIIRKEQNNIDLVYLDIHMDGKDGVTVAKEIRELGGEMEIVFCTSDNSHMGEAFDVEAMNYIVKGTMGYDKFQEIFLHAAEKARHRKKTCLSLVENRKAIEIPLSEITYFEVFNRVIKTHYIRNGVTGEIESYGSLKGIEEKLNNPTFIRVHNSYLVNKSYIAMIFTTELEMKDGTRIPVSRTHKKNVIAGW